MLSSETKDFLETEPEVVSGVSVCQVMACVCVCVCVCVSVQRSDRQCEDFP